MSEKPNLPTPSNEPLIPSVALLAVAGAGFLVALINLFTSPSFGVIGYAGLAVGVIGMLVWAFMNPDDVLDMVRGRGLTFGGTAIIVVIVLIVASALIYNVVKTLGLRQDFTDRDIYSLSEGVRDLVQSIANDPTTPPISIIGFFGAIDAGERDRSAILLDEFVELGNGKISYEFIDPNREPLRAALYAPQSTTETTGTTAIRSGQFAVTPLLADGSPDFASVELVNITDQYQLVNAMITAIAGGDYRGFVLNVTNGLALEGTDQFGMSTIASVLRDRFKWTLEAINPLELTGDTPRVSLVDPLANGITLVIPGGAEPLTDEVVTAITNYLSAGGDAVLLGGLNPEGNDSLLTAENMATYLWDNFGVRVRNDFVIDPDATTQLGLFLNTYGAHPVTATFGEGQGTLFFNSHSIEIDPAGRPNVTVTPLVTTGVNAYSKLGIDFTQELTQAAIDQTPEDISGALVMAVAIENSATGARLFISGTESLAYNAFAQFADVNNLDMFVQSLFWTTDYSSFATELATVQPDINPEDAPIFITDEQARTLNFVALGVIPFGILGIGLATWWARRERRFA